MSVSPSAAATVREHFKAIDLYLKHAPLDVIIPGAHLAGAFYEFNRACSVSAIRSLAGASETQLREDILENIRLLLTSSFEETVLHADEASMLETSTELYQTLLASRALSATAN